MRLAIVLAFVFSPVAVSAQNIDNVSGLVASCGSGSCQNALAGTLARMDLNTASNPSVEEDLAAIALALFGVARTAEDTRVEVRVAEALIMLSDVAPDEPQSTLFRDVANAILTGETDLYDTIDPFSASPS